VPPLSEKTIKELATFIPLAGNSIRNPLDVWMVQHEVEMFRRAVNVAAADPNIDFIIADHYSAEDADNEPDYEEKERVVDDFIIDFAKNNPYGKPLVLAMNVFDPLPENVAAAAKVRRKFALAGIPSYASQANATKAISRFIKYYEFLAQSRG
jgi:acyl-CoA synthetase (NDP forming)